MDMNELEPHALLASIISVQGALKPGEIVKDLIHCWISADNGVEYSDSTHNVYGYGPYQMVFCQNSSSLSSQ